MNIFLTLTNDALISSAVPDSINESVRQSSGDVLITLVVILILVFLSALLSASRAGFFALTSSEREKISQGVRAKGKTSSLLKKPEKLLTTLLVSVIFLNVAVIIFLARLIPLITGIAINSVTGVVVLITSGTFIILLFCEILPKIFGSLHPMGVIRFMGVPLFFLDKILSPLNYLLIGFSSSLTRHKKNRENISVDEISQAFELSAESELSEDKEILEGIVNFGSKSVAEIMCPRVDVVATDIKSSFTKVLELINSSGYSRIPVYSESFDQVKGILFIKDLLPHTEKGTEFKWQALLRPPFFVPETKKVKDLLEDFQKNKIHLAVVVDEYGGSSGIVTLEDVLEEIVGEIADEFDEEEKFFTKLGEKKYLFDGKIQLDDFIEVMDCRNDYFDEIKGDADTLAGLILEIKGEIPASHEKIEYKDFRFTIESISNRRIRQVRVELK